MTRYLVAVLVLFSPLVSSTPANRCILGISSPDVINGSYAPALHNGEPVWAKVDEGGLMGDISLRKLDGRYYFFKGDDIISSEANIDYLPSTKCFNSASNIVSSAPETHIYELNSPLAGPGLGKIVDVHRSSKETKTTFQACLQWVIQLHTDAAPIGLNWNYKNHLCIAVWDGQAEHLSSSTTSHWRHLIFEPIDLPGSSIERRYIGNVIHPSQRKPIDACIELAVSGMPVEYMMHHSGKCYTAGGVVIGMIDLIQPERILQGNHWTIRRVSLPGQHFPLNFDAPFKCELM